MKPGRRKFLKSSALLAAFGSVPMKLGYSCQQDSTLMDMGLQKQLFFDDLLIESVQDITREFHSPRKYEGNPVLVKDRLWEHVLLVRASSYRVLRDSKDRLFKCWYSDEGWTNELLRRGVTEAVYRNLYAYSEDGIHWVKPSLGFYRENGQDTNIYWGDGQSISAEVRDVILDPFESNESKRFKSIHLEGPVDKNGQGHIGQGQAYMSYSADGVHWKTFDEMPSFGRFGARSNDVIILNYDLKSRSYLLNTRHLRQSEAALNPRFPTTRSFFRPYSPRNLARMNKRRIFRCESSDFIHWSEPSLILAPDEEDNLDDSLYAMAQYRVGNTWVGFVNILHSVANVMSVQLAHSIDGQCWKRIRKPWFTAGPEGSWDQIMVEVANEPLEMGDELWFYYGGSGWGHHDWYSEGIREELDVAEAKDVSKVGFFLGLAKLRLDGFCSLNAGPVREGILITRPLASPGLGITMNAECGQGGHIDVEILNQADEVMSGYSRKDFDRFTGDTVRHQLSWHSRAKVPPEPFRRLVFYMRNAKLYSFNFSA